MAVYDPKSLKAEEFINDEEIRETLAYAEANKNNVELIDSILEKARPRKGDKGYVCTGLTHREASVLLSCEIPEKIERMYEIAEEIKMAYYGNRIVIFAPLYLSNYCVNGCLYCPYHMKNKHIPRKKLTQEEVRAEVIALQDMGHKRLAIEAGEDPVNNPIEYILECIDTIYSVHHKNGDIRRVNVNIAATTVENYKKLKDAGIGTYILFQETYHKESYLRLHPTGPKHDYAYHTEAHDRAMEGGIDDVGLGVLFGLEMYKYEFAGLLMHAEHLEAVHGVGPHTISVPRVKRADDIDPDAFDNGIDDLARRIRNIKRPVVCANYDFSQFDMGRRGVQPYTIVRKAGMKIGIIGMLTDISKVVVYETASRVPRAEGTDAEIVNKWADYLRNKKKCDMVIVLSHMGLNEDLDIIPQIRNVDIIVGGHSHTFMKGMEYRTDLDGKQVPVIQDGCWGLNIGRIDVID